MFLKNLSIRFSPFFKKNIVKTPRSCAECEFFPKNQRSKVRSIFTSRFTHVFFFFTDHHFVFKCKMDKRLPIPSRACYALLVVVLGHDVDAGNPEVLIGPQVEWLIRSQLIIPVLRDVTHPRQSLVAALLDDLQVTHLNTGRGEVRYLELHLYGRLALGVFADHRR